MTRNLLPGKPVPNFEINTITGDKWKLSAQNPKLFTLIDIYRGLHCGRCKFHLEEITANLAKFEQLGVNVLAISMDSVSRCKKTVQQWNIAGLNIGYGLTFDQASLLDLYFSKPIRETEPDIFCEPATLLISPNGELYGAVHNSFPFIRPHIEDILELCEVVGENNYPPRGSYVE